jgi:Protein of unknown function (DUF4239)
MKRTQLHSPILPFWISQPRPTGVLTILQSIFIAIAIVLASVAFLFLLNRFWPNEVRREHNDIVGWQVSVVGTTYAVIIGFMLYAVWTDFEAAKVNVDAEANALVNVSRLAEGLPQEQRDKVQSIARRYADLMVTAEWPSMRERGTMQGSADLTEQLWRAVTLPGQIDGFQNASLDHTFSELTELTEHRRMRQLQSESGLPGILWSVLIVGAVITISSACLFGTRSFSLHCLQVLGLSTLVALSLVAVAEIARPFQGSVRVNPDAFIEAQQSLRTHTQSLSQ